MIEIKIQQIAKKHGFTNAYGLQKALKCSPTMASRLWKNDFKRVDVATLDNLCGFFDCEPSDLLAYSSPTGEPKKLNREPVIAETLASDGLLTAIQVGERLGLSRRRVNDYIVSGELKAVKGKGSHNFISEIDLQEFIFSRGGGRE